MVKVIYCNTLFVPVLNVWELIPSEILTLPVFVFLAILIVMTVPGGNSWPKVRVKSGLVALIVEQLAVFAAAPAKEIAPIELFGLTPPVAAITPPVVGTGCSATSVAVKVVLTVILLILIVALPATSKVTCWLAPPLILYVTIAFGVPPVKVKVPFPPLLTIKGLAVLVVKTTPGVTSMHTCWEYVQPKLSTTL